MIPRPHRAWATAPRRALEARGRSRLTGKVPSATRVAEASGGQLGHEPELLETLAEGEGDRGDGERADARVAVECQSLAHDLGRAAQRHLVDQRIRQRRHRLLALAFEVEVLNPLRLGLEAVTLDELVVEVLLARA